MKSNVIIGDSSITIRFMHHSSPSKDYNIARLAFRIQEAKQVEMVLPCTEGTQQTSKLFGQWSNQFECRSS